MLQKSDQRLENLKTDKAPAHRSDVDFKNCSFNRTICIHNGCVFANVQIVNMLKLFTVHSYSIIHHSHVGIVLNIRVYVNIVLHSTV